MKQHEREYFISRTRIGYYPIKIDSFTLKVYPPTNIDEFEANVVYNEAYEQAIEDEIKTEQEIFEWMMERNLWSKEEDEKIEATKKDIESLKVEIFNSRNNSDKVTKIRRLLRNAESQLIELSNKKNAFFSNTCESVAMLEKSFALLKRCTYLGKELYNFEEINMDFILSQYYSMVIPETKIRDLARNEPWRSIWILNESKLFNLFENNGRELSPDQRNLITWSKMYDNVQESLDCPSDNVINDDDMLDGWFIVQRRKREKDKVDAELNDSLKNDKIKNSSEIFFMAGNKQDVEKIHDMNDINAKITKKQREAVIKQKGGASQLDFQDEKISLANKSNQMFKDNFRR